jgi:toxin ParE1/3/4
MTAPVGYELSPAADADLVKIYRYTEQTYGEAQAGRYLDDLEKAFEDLAANPLSGRARHELRKGLRSLVKNSHLIFYRPLKDRIRIVRVLAMTQDMERALKKKRPSGLSAAGGG